jgi:replicative DNA helicase
MTENEEIFLGQILLDNSVLDRTIIRDIHFLNGQCRQVFQAIKKAREDMKHADLVTVRNADTSLDSAYLASLTNKVASAANWESYEGELIKSFQYSRLHTTGKAIVEMVERRKSPEEILNFLDKALVEMTTKVSKNEIKKMSECIRPYLEKLEARYNAKGGLAGISSGLEDLDNLTSGFQDSMLYIIGGRPSHGKSALGLNMANHAAVDEKIPTGFISLESSDSEITGRSFAAEGHIDGNKLLKGKLTSADFHRVMETAGRLYNSNLFIYDVPNTDIATVRSIARRMVAIHKTKIIFIDYLQIIKHPNISLPFHERIADISTSLKNISRELSIPIVAFAQLRRDSAGRRPTMEDFSDSSQIEKDADGAILIYHYKDKEGVDRSKLLAEKIRDGQVGEVDVVFRREYVKFYPLEKVSVDTVHK